MTNDQIKEIAQDVLGHRLQGYGFQEAEVRPEIDFDGSPVIRIVARYASEDVPTEAITQSLHDIRSKLLDRAEERFVLLESAGVDVEPIDEDVD